MDDDDVVVVHSEQPAVTYSERIERVDPVPGESLQRTNVLEDVRRVGGAGVAEKQHRQPVAAEVCASRHYLYA
jgi:hypothetical protein